MKTFNKIDTKSTYTSVYFTFTYDPDVQLIQRNLHFTELHSKLLSFKIKVTANLQSVEFLKWFNDNIYVTLDIYLTLMLKFTFFSNAFIKKLTVGQE